MTRWHSPDHAATVEHPNWCDLTRCTATSAVTRGGIHRGTPVTVAVRGTHGGLEVTAVLSQAHCRWPTEVYVDFNVKRLRRKHQIAGGMAAFTVEKLAAIGQLAMDLAGISGSDQATNESPLRQLPGRAHQPGQVAALAGGDRR